MTENLVQGAEAMKKTHTAVGVALLATATLFWGSGLGQAQQGMPEKKGEKLEDAGRSIKEGLENAKEAVRGEFTKIRAAVHDMGIMSRVYGRLHWDKALTTGDLDLKVEAGTVTLRGVVPSPEARTKAVTLARDTVGVTRVIDELTVLPESQKEPVHPPRTTT
jgi:hyperosmotically inducible periplasmic protein